MYPVIRIVKELLLYGKSHQQSLMDVYESNHICWPWDLDLWMELNNGRTLTIYDLGRVPLIRRVGLHSLVKENGWRFSVAGSVIRYRRRVKVFDKLKMRSRIVSWDERFLYLEQSMWRGSEATSQAVFRMAISNKKGLIPLRKVIEAFGGQLEKPDMPEWIEDWISSEFKRPWPPN